MSKASEEALEWHVRLTSGAATEEDWQAHLDWLGTNPGNLDAFDRVQRSWAGLDVARDAVVGAFPVAEGRKIGRAQSGRFFAGWRDALSWPARAPMWQGALAGVAAVILVVLAVSQLTSVVAPAPQTYATAVGEMKTVQLADGSTATLDTDTEIKVLYSGQTRTADVVHGSVLFDVAHNASRPFKVTAGPHEISVLGTKFEVSLRDQRTVVAVARGIVAVSETSTAAGSSTANSYRLEKGQRLVYASPTSAPVSETVDPDNVGSWEHGQLVFNGAPLAQVVTRLNRYFPDMKLEVGDPSIADKMFTGVVKIGGPEETARRLAEIMSLDYNVSGDTIRLLPNNPDKT